MRHQHSVVFRFPTIVLPLCLCLFGAAQAHANPVVANEYSISNGAQLYELYCSECHGQEVTGNGQDYGPDQANPGEDYTELVEIVREDESAQLIPVPEEEKWPEWADRPDPHTVEKPNTKTEVLNTLTAVIEGVHDAKPGRSASADPTVPDRADAFDPVPGATNLADPTVYFHGTSEQEVFNSIATGTGAAMSGWRAKLGSDQAIWDVVNYIRSFWGEDWLY